MNFGEVSYKSAIMISGFTRQEVIALTGVKSGKLSYLDRIKLVMPQKFGGKHPVVVYSVKQVLQIKVISKLRERSSLQEIRKVINFLQGHNFNSFILGCDLVLIEGCLYLVEDWQDFGMTILKSANQNNGRVTVYQIGKMTDILSEVRTAAGEQNVLDFERRFLL